MAWRGERTTGLARRIVMTAAALLIGSGAAAAQAVHDAQFWTQVVATVSVGDDWLVHLEGQPRWANDMSSLAEVIARTAVGRRVGERVSVWGGYAWIPQTLGPGTSYEQRIWQQFSSTVPALGKWRPSLRVRVEQRFLERWADNSHRVRLMGRVVRPIDANGLWSIAASNEAMITLDDTARGPAQGFDQNRLFGGLSRRLSSQASIEGGYLWRTSKIERIRTHVHVAFMGVNLEL